VKPEKTVVVLHPLGYESLNTPRGYADQGGSFTIKGVAPGLYQVEVSSLEETTSFYVKSVRLGDREITGDVLDLTEGVSGTLQITLSAETAQVAGVVQDSDNKPVSAATVVAVPDSRRYSLYRQETTDQFGAFTVRGLAPGEYKLLAWEDIEAGAYQDPEILKKYEGKAETLSLKPNDRKSVQVRVIPFENVR
jgi:hypothetical protein